jgi:hypothetical protein
MGLNFAQQLLKQFIAAATKEIDSPDASFLKVFVGINEA